MSTCYFTVVTRNYLRYADSLYESLKVTSLNFHFYCLVVDAIRTKDEELLNKARFNILYPTELNIQNYDYMKVYYDAFELCNALKAATMRHILFELKFGTGIYLDSDILVFSSFAPILEKMKNASFGFSPHFISPLPHDDMRPSNLTFLQTGIFNGGIWIFNQTNYSRDVLNWLIQASQTLGFNDLSKGMFVDQKLICLVAGMFNSEFFAINYAGCNVAYWNLHERAIEFSNGRYLVNSEPLICFHYSGYKPGSLLLSSHSERFKDLPKNSEVLMRILQRYNDLLEQSELSFTKELPYRFNEMNGIELNSFIRKYYFSNRSFSPPLIFNFLFRVARRLRHFGNILESLLYKSQRDLGKTFSLPK